MEKLYKLTPLENTFSANFTVLHNEKPKVLGVKDILSYWCNFRINTKKRSLVYDIEKISKELELLHGLGKILTSIDECIDIIKNSKNDKDAISKLIDKYKLNETQAEYVANIKIRSLNQDNINKQLNKTKELENEIKKLNDLLWDETSIRKILSEELLELGEKYNVPRKTTLLDLQDTKLKEDILIENYNLNLVLSKDGYLKKVKLTSLRGASEYRFKDGDELLSIRQTSNKNDLLVFTNQQNCYKLKIHEIQDHKPSVLGLYLPSHLQLNEDEHIIDVIPTNYSEEILIAYENGKVARVPLSSYETKTNRTKLSNATYSENIVGIHIYEDAKYILATDDRALIFKGRDIPLKTSRNTQGITTMKYTNMSKVVKFKKVSDCKLDTQSRYIPEGNGKAGRKIHNKDII